MAFSTVAGRLMLSSLHTADMNSLDIPLPPPAGGQAQSPSAMFKTPLAAALIEIFSSLPSPAPNILSF